MQNRYALGAMRFAANEVSSTYNGLQICRTLFRLGCSISLFSGLCRQICQRIRAVESRGSWYTQQMGHHGNQIEG